MAQIRHVIEGLEILAKTARIPYGLASSGETDTRTASLGGAAYGVIYGPDADPLPEDIERLEEIGWFLDDGFWSLFV